MKCILCGQRKGKRHCPAKNGLICPQCCGEKRMVEIDCPPDCKYLRSGQRHANRRMAAQFGRSMPAARLQKYIQDLERFAPFVVMLEREVVKFARGLSRLDEETMLAAVQLAKETMSTEARGIIYEHRSPNPLVEKLSRALLEAVDDMRSAEFREETGLPRLSAQDAVNCLECLQVQAEDFRASHEEGAYLTFLRRNHPDMVSEEGGEEDEDGGGSPLIIQP